MSGERKPAGLLPPLVALGVAVLLVGLAALLWREGAGVEPRPAQLASAPDATPASSSSESDEPASIDEAATVERDSDAGADASPAELFGATEVTVLVLSRWDAPIAGATARLLFSEEERAGAAKAACAEAVSDADGLLRLQGFPELDLALVVEAPGFRTHRSTFVATRRHRLGDAFGFNARKRVVLDAAGDVRVEGRLVTPEGRALTEAEVYELLPGLAPWEPAPRNGETRRSADEEPFTGASRFTLEIATAADAPPHVVEVDLDAERAAYAEAVPAAASGHLRLFADGRLAAEREWRALEGSYDLVVDLAAWRASGCALTVELVDATSQSPLVPAGPAPSMQLEVERLASEHAEARVVRADGKARMHFSRATPAEYEIFARADGYAPSLIRCSLVQGRREHVLVPMRPPSRFVFSAPAPARISPAEAQIEKGRMLGLVKSSGSGAAPQGGPFPLLEVYDAEGKRRLLWVLGRRVEGRLMYEVAEGPVGEARLRWGNAERKVTLEPGANPEVIVGGDDGGR